jgi:hypothetical protein
MTTATVYQWVSQVSAEVRTELTRSAGYGAEPHLGAWGLSAKRGVWGGAPSWGVSFGFFGFLSS